MIVHRRSRTFKLALLLPLWTCHIVKVRVGTNTRDFYAIRQPLWLAHK